MKWFKHDGNALHNAKIEKLIMKYGIEGYGLYFACIEIIAGALTTENINFELKHDAEVLGYKFKIDTIKVEKIMKYMVELGLFQYNKTTGNIVCLKLLERLDISTSNSPAFKDFKKKLDTNSNYKELLETNRYCEQNRIESNRIEYNKDICSSEQTHVFSQETCKLRKTSKGVPYRWWKGTTKCEGMCEFNCPRDTKKCYEWFNRLLDIADKAFIEQTGTKKPKTVFRADGTYGGIFTNKFYDIQQHPDSWLLREIKQWRDK